MRDLQIGGALMWVGGDGLMMLFGVGVTMAMITHTGSTQVIGQRLEAIRRSALTEHLALAGSAGTTGDDSDSDEDDAMLDAYNQMLARMNGQPTPAPPDESPAPGGRTRPRTWSASASWSGRSPPP